MATPGNILSAYALYQGTTFTGFSNNNQIGINSNLLDAYSPRYVWLKRVLIPGQNQIQVLLTFEPSSVEVADPNILQGVYIEVTGVGVMIDCISVQNFIDACNGVGSITRRYAAGVTAFTSPTPLCYQIARFDDASTFAHGDFSTDYVGQYVGNAYMVSHITGVSLYRVASYTVPIPIGSDIVTITTGC